MKNKKLPYYALWCTQNHEYMHSGRNDRTLEDLKQSLLSYISPDLEEGQEAVYSKLSAEELAEMWEFEIHKQATPFDEEVL